MSFSTENIFVVPNRECPYITNQKSITEHYLDEVDISTYTNLLIRGWRRFGKHFFAPKCPWCDQCFSMRIPVEKFELTRSFKRVIKVNENTRLIIRKPTISKEHMALYAKFHDYRTATRGWEEDTNGTVEYFTAFVDGANDYGYEFAYYADKKLIAVALVDILPMGVSAVYCYYDPDFAHLSLGTYSILKQIEFAKKQQIPHLYLGYWVPENASLSYKARFKPFEILQGRPTLDQVALWGDHGEN